MNKNEKINLYISMLIEANKKMNLSGAQTYEDFKTRHIEDSLALLNFIDIKKGTKIVDMGTGAGFPGIPLAIFTDAKFTLVDSLKKRINFLESVVRELNLNNVSLSDLRAEEFCRDDKYREQFDIAVSRALAPLNLLLEYIVPSLKLGGRFYSYKSSNVATEVEKAKNAMNELKVILKSEFEYKINAELQKGLCLKILEFEKVDICPDKYPRRVGIPAKRPL